MNFRNVNANVRPMPYNRRGVRNTSGISVNRPLPSPETDNSILFPLLRQQLRQCCVELSEFVPPGANLNRRDPRVRNLLTRMLQLHNELRRLNPFYIADREMTFMDRLTASDIEVVNVVPPHEKCVVCDRKLFELYRSDTFSFYSRPARGVCAICWQGVLRTLNSNH